MNERMHELLADVASGARLEPEEQRELDVMLAVTDDARRLRESFEEAASALHLALIAPHVEPMPVRVRAAVLERARGLASEASRPPRPRAAAPGPMRSPVSPPSVTGAERAPSGSLGAYLGWIVAAAACLALLMRSTYEPPRVEGAPTLEQLVARADAVRVPWGETGDPDGVGVTGDVVWSEGLQTGFMRFEGLPENDPTKAQYQLWIFDAERPQEHPVDGGVFDSNGGELVVPIDAKLAVAAPTLFAVTLERPGGVVVSSRERLVLAAAVE